MARHKKDLGRFCAKLINVAVFDLNIHAWNAVRIMRGAHNRALGRSFDRLVAANVVGVVMGIENMRDAPTQLVGLGHDFIGQGWVDHRHSARDGLAHQIDVVIVEDGNLTNIEHHECSWVSRFIYRHILSAPLEACNARC